MMTRVAVIALLLGAPMTIVHTTSRNHPGFRVRLTYQIGCATTGDIPSEETTRAAQADQARRLDDLEPLLKRAFEFFARGDHPFTRFRKFLVDGPSDQETAEVFWQDAHVSLFVRPDTPDIVRKKLAFDFVLSLAFDPELKRTTPFAARTDPKARLADVVVRHDWVSRFVAHACRRPEELRTWAAAPIDASTMTSQHAYDESHRLIKAKALQRVLDRKPYGADVLAAATALSRTESVRDLLMFSSDVQSAELKGVLDLLSGIPDALAYYEPLL